MRDPRLRVRLPVTVEQVDELVHRVLGTATLRPGQREAIDGTLTHDTLAVLATGVGKTLVYQVAGRILGGTTVVVSPTLSLQQDQLAGLNALAPAAVLNSLLSPRQRDAVLSALARRELGYLLVGPEQLQLADVAEALDRADVRLVAVDEAQCVTSWGHDFRPDYLALPGWIDRIGRPRVVALTATASREVRAEIVAALEMIDAVVVVGEFDRPNIWLAAREVEDHAAVTGAVLDALHGRARAADATIVYVSTRARAEELAAVLREAGHAAAHYHGSLSRAQRARTADGFHDGSLPVVVATSAFGLGINKPDVRLVVHADPPQDLDELYQEIGRAGRDGEPSRAVLISRPGAYGLPHLFAAQHDARPEDLRTVLAVVDDAAAGLAQLQSSSGLSRPRLQRAVNALVAVGALATTGGELYAAGDCRRPVADAVEVDRRRRLRAETGVELVRRYAETTDCRRRLILQLLGESVDEPCRRCDNCAAGTSVGVGRHPFAVGARVRHPQWGTGTVQQWEHDRVVVLFASAGYRTLAWPLAEEHHLLEESTG